MPSPRSSTMSSSCSLATSISPCTMSATIGLAGLRRLQPDHRRHAGRRLGSGRGRASGRRSASAGPAARCSRPHRVQLLGRRPAVIGLALGQQAHGRPRHAAPARSELEHRRLVGVEPEPAQTVEDRVDRPLGGALPVGVLDAQQVAAAVVPGEQPVEQAPSARRRCADNLWAKEQSVTTTLMVDIRRPFAG